MLQVKLIAKMRVSKAFFQTEKFEKKKKLFENGRKHIFQSTPPLNRGITRWKEKWKTSKIKIFAINPKKKKVLSKLLLWSGKFQKVGIIYQAILNSIAQLKPQTFWYNSL